MDAPKSATAAEREAADTERRGAAAEAALHDFAATVALATDADEVERALAAAVAWTSDGLARLARGDAPAGRGTAVPVRVEGGRAWGRIDLDGPSDDPGVVRRLETVATLAALALDRLDGASKARARAATTAAEPPATVGLQDATLLGAVLPFAIGQARRHDEPLSLLLLTIDQLRAVRALLGADEADRVVARVGCRIAALLRASDLVGRLDGDRLMAVLPRAELGDAAEVGRKLARKVAADASLSGLPLALSLTIGAAEFPGSSETLGGLLDAADAALAEARRGETPAASRA